MAKFTLKKPKAPKKGSKSPKAFADSYDSYIRRLKEYNSKKSAHEKANKSKGKNLHAERLKKLKEQAAKLR